MIKNPEQTVGALIDSQQAAFLGSVDGDGFPNMKAMLSPRKREGIKVFYFSTNTSSMRVGQYRTNPKACLYFYDRPKFLGAMLTGTMEVIEDPVYKEALWKAGDTMYYPLGMTDPDYCVLKFTAISGRLYSGLKSDNFEV